MLSLITNLLFFGVNMITNRIKTIAKYIFPFKKIADVGCDHGYLIIEAFENQNITHAIAIDNKKGPLSKAQENMMNKKYFQNIRFSLSSGISDIENDTDCVIISGMGGLLISQIIDLDYEKLVNVQRLILVPHKDHQEVRKTVIKYGFKISYEKIIFEANKYYTIIVCDKTCDNIEYSDNELIYGPLLLKEKDELFFKMYEEQINRLQNIIDNTNDENTIKILKSKINEIRSIL